MRGHADQGHRADLVLGGAEQAQPLPACAQPVQAVPAQQAVDAADVVINLAGIKELGLGGYLKHLTAGAPVFVWPIIIPIEILGTFIKPVALAIRLADHLKGAPA